MLIVRAPQTACLIFFDFLDGEVARTTRSDSEFGSLIDQVSDHIREITLVCDLVAGGQLRVDIGIAYALAYPLANFLLYLAGRGQVPVTFSIKTWMLFYPGLIAFWWLSVNVLDYIVVITAGLLAVAGSQPYGTSVGRPFDEATDFGG
jgi:phosphatidylglycerophosphate synthase